MSATDTKQTEEIVDITQLSDEQIANFNDQADPFAPPPPPDDGVHVVTLAFVEPDPQKRWKKNPDGSLKTQVVATIAKGEKFENRKVFDRMVSTKVQQSTGSTRAAGMIRAFQELPKGGHASQALQLTNLIEQGLQVNIRTEWRLGGEKSSDGSYEKDRIRGQKNFPVQVDSEGQAMVNDEGVEVRQHLFDDGTSAQASVISYHSL